MLTSFFFLSPITSWCKCDVIKYWRFKWYCFQLQAHVSSFILLFLYNRFCFLSSFCYLAFVWTDHIYIKSKDNFFRLFTLNTHLLTFILCRISWQFVYIFNIKTPAGVIETAWKSDFFVAWDNIEYLNIEYLINPCSLFRFILFSQIKMKHSFLWRTFRISPGLNWIGVDYNAARVCGLYASFLQTALLAFLLPSQSVFC